uniref:C-type lectin domain-containing protein n=1 Tax=Maylandia zebra TaxID=106582 RepID=A0A3P9DL01_9CICH
DLWNLITEHTDIIIIVVVVIIIKLCLLSFFPQHFKTLNNDPCYKCEDGWKQHGEKCYFFSTSKSSWNVSSTGCSTKGGDLVKIDTIQQKIKSYDDLFWIGLTDSAVEGRWLWVDGSPLNERFDSAQLHYITLHTYEMYYMVCLFTITVTLDGGL